jgi:hypothetical protein
MLSPLFANFSLISGAIDQGGRLCLLAEHDQKAEEDVPHTAVFIVENSQVQDQVLTPWRAAGVSSLGDNNFFIVGEDGDYLHYLAGELIKGNIFKEYNQKNSFIVRNIISSSGVVYVVGMSGGLLKIDMSTKQAQDLAQKISEKPNFEGLVVDEPGGLVAYGWKGNVWQYLDHDWQKIKILSSEIFTCGLQTPKGLVYLGGRNGSLIYRLGQSWHLAQLEKQLSVDIWSLDYFQEKLLVLTEASLYQLENNTLTPLGLNTTSQGLSLKLLSHHNSLYLLSEKSLITTEDLANWADLDLKIML